MAKIVLTVGLCLASLVGLSNVANAGEIVVGNWNNEKDCLEALDDYVNRSGLYKSGYA